MNKKIVFILFSISLIGSQLTFINYYFNYLKYASFILAFYFLIVNRGLRKLTISNDGYLIAFIILFYSSIFRLGQYNYNTINYALIILAPCLPFIFFIHEKISIKKLNYVILLGVPLSFREIPQFNFSIEYGASQFSNVESNIIPYVIGLFFLWSVIEKKKLLVFLNAIALIIVFKRMALVGVFITLISSFFVQKLNRKLVVLTMVFVNLIWVYISYYITTVDFSELTQVYLKLYPAEITTGRSVFYTEIFNNLKFNFFELIGRGEGFTSMITKDRFGLIPHNDILSIYIDHGLFVLVGFVFLLYSSPNIKRMFPFVFFFNLSLFTDNTKIYSPVVLAFFIVLHFYSIEDNEQKKIQS